MRQDLQTTWFVCNPRSDGARVKEEPNRYVDDECPSWSLVFVQFGGGGGGENGDVDGDGDDDNGVGVVIVDDFSSFRGGWYCFCYCYCIYCMFRDVLLVLTRFGSISLG